jgi:hypothetical protein
MRAVRADFFRDSCDRAGGVGEWREVYGIAVFSGFADFVAGMFADAIAGEVAGGMVTGVRAWWQGCGGGVTVRRLMPVLQAIPIG